MSFHIKQEKKDVARRSAGWFRSLLSWLIFKQSFAIRQEDALFHVDLMCRLSGWEITRPGSRGSTPCVQMGEPPLLLPDRTNQTHSHHAHRELLLWPWALAWPHFALQYTLGALIPRIVLQGGKYFHNFTDLKGISTAILQILKGDIRKLINSPKVTEEPCGIEGTWTEIFYTSTFHLSRTSSSELFLERCLGCSC